VSGESGRLRDRGAAQWAAAIAHPMVAEIGAGTLPHATFRFYFEQNLRYLGEYARAIAFAAAGTADRGALSVLARFLGQIADVEIPANEAFLERLGGSPGCAAAMLPTTYAYTRHLARSLPADPVYRNWIALFSGDGYDDLVVASTDLLDSSCTVADQAATSDAFDRSVRYEIAFWQMAYTRGESDRVISA
jgi:thiaminase (transcriptional activator TenA)